MIDNGEIVAALIDGQTTLKRFLMQRKKTYLRAENPKYPDLIPRSELVIQGVIVHFFVRLAAIVDLGYHNDFVSLIFDANGINTDRLHRI